MFVKVMVTICRMRNLKGPRTQIGHLTTIVVVFGP